MSNVNRAAEFLPQTTEDERPAVRIAGALVFVYVDDYGTLRVTVDTEDVDADEPTNIQFNVNNGTVWTGTD